MISGIAWVSKLVAITSASGEDVFPDLARQPAATGHPSIRLK